MKIIFHTILLIALSIITGCSPGNREQAYSETDSSALDSVENISYLLISPGEIFEYIFSEELKPDPSFVNPATNAKKYVTTKKMALNLGVYTTNFIYLNMSSDKTKVLDYYKVILEIAPKIHIYAGANDNLPERIQKNFASHDSVSELSKQVYYRIMEDLEEKAQHKTYALIAGGVLIESVYLGVMNVKKYEEFKSLTQKLFEQKELLNNTYNFIASTPADQDIDWLLNKLDDLKLCFSNLETINKDVNVSRNSNGKIKVNGGAEIITAQSDFEKLKTVAVRIRNEIISE